MIEHYDTIEVLKAENITAMHGPALVLGFIVRESSTPLRAGYCATITIAKHKYGRAWPGALSSRDYAQAEAILSTGTRIMRMRTVTKTTRAGREYETREFYEVPK